jgi:N utilization substance protein A
VQSIRVKRDSQEMVVVVDDEQLSLAIGREGQNVRLAVRLTGWKIDLVSSTEMLQRERLDKEMRVALDEVEGFTAEEVAQLGSIGLHTLKELNAADVEDLLRIDGMDEENVARLRAVGSERAKQIEMEFAEALKAQEHLFDEQMFDRVPAPEAEPAAATLTFKDESELEGEEAPPQESPAAEAEEEPRAATEDEPVAGEGDVAAAEADTGEPEAAEDTEEERTS